MPGRHSCCLQASLLTSHFRGWGRQFWYPTVYRVRKGVVLALLMPGGIRITRLMVGVGVDVTEVVTGLTRLTVHADVYGDVFAVRHTLYPTLMVVYLFLSAGGN